MDTVPRVSRRGLALLVTCLLLPAWRQGSGVEGHGRLIDPPSRATMWRYGFDTKADYDDNAGYCGGKSVSQSSPVLSIYFSSPLGVTTQGEKRKKKKRKEKIYKTTH